MTGCESQHDATGADSPAYDQANRLVSATVNGQTTTFAYDGDGKRTRKVAGGQPTDYTYDVATRLPVLLEDGQRKYVWGRGLLYATNPAGTAVASVYQRDGLGTVRALTDGTGALTDTRDVDAFGLPTRSQGPSAQPFGFTGEQRDAETGFVYLRARYYDPALGRFLQRDPLGGRLTRPITLNRYVYADNNPVNSVDPSGLRTYFVGGIQGTEWSQHTAFVEALQTAGIQNVTQVPAFDYEASLFPDKMADVVARSLGFTDDPDARTLADMIIADVNSGQYHGEQFNIIGYSGGATVGINAAEILAEQGYGIDHLVMIGGFSVEPPPENVVSWTRVHGQYDELNAMPGFPDLDVTFLGVHHEEYFTEENIDITVDIVQAAGVE